MNRHVQASAPKLYRLASRSKIANDSLHAASTLYTKQAHLIDTASRNSELVDEAIKLGSAVLQSVKATKEQEAAEAEQARAAIEKKTAENAEAQQELEEAQAEEQEVLEAIEEEAAEEPQQ